MDKAEPPCYDDCFEDVPYPPVPNGGDLLDDIKLNWAEEDTQTVLRFEEMRKQAQETLEQKIAELKKEYQSAVHKIEILKNTAQREIARKRALKVRTLMRGGYGEGEDETIGVDYWYPFKLIFNGA